MIPVLDISPKDSETRHLRVPCTSILTATLVTSANLWNQPRYPSAAEWSEEQNHVICKKMHAAADKLTKRVTPISERQIAYVSSDFHVDS